MLLKIVVPVLAFWMFRADFALLAMMIVLLITWLLIAPAAASIR